MKSGGRREDEEWRSAGRDRCVEEDSQTLANSHTCTCIHR